jgi:hypothetical protein
VLPGEVQEGPRIRSSIGRDRADFTLLEQVSLIVERRNVAQVNSCHRQSAAPIQRLQRGQHEVADRREQDGRIQRNRRRVVGALSLGGAQFQRKLTRLGAAGHHVHLGTLGQGDLRGDMGTTAEPIESQPAARRQLRP